MGLRKLRKETIDREKNEDEHSKRKVTTVKLDLNLKPDQMQSNAQKIRSNLEYKMHDDGGVKDFCEGMTGVYERMPDIELARLE